MIVCRKCSRRHPDGTDFCACGAFLEFDGEHVADDPPPSSGAGPSGTGTSGTGTSGGGTSGGGTSGGGAVAAPTPISAPPPGGAGTSPATSWGTSQPPPASPTAPPSTSGWSHAPGGGEPAPWSGFEPRRPAGGDEPSVRAQLPDTPVAPPAAEPVDVRPTLRPGDVACERCGTPNPPNRQFCQKCGNALTAVPPLPADGTARDRSGRSWGRRLRSTLRRAGIPTNAEQLASEAHVLSRGGLSSRTMLFRGGGVAVLLGGMLAFLGPWRSTVVAWARDRVGASSFEIVDVEPEQVESVPADPLVAPVAFPLQDADRTVDRYLNTSWATQWLDPVGHGLESAPDDSACQDVEHTDSFLRVTFAAPTDIARFSVVAGRYDGDESRGTYFRPRVVELRWHDRDAEPTADTSTGVGAAPADADEQCRYVELPDTGELSVHELGISDVELVDIRVVGVHADPESVPTVDISEIVFERDR